MNTEATEYAFINEETAQIVCHNLSIKFLFLLKFRSLKDFDENLTFTLVTHAIYLNLTVHNHSEFTAFILIIKLSSYFIILSKL